MQRHTLEERTDPFVLFPQGEALFVSVHSTQFRCALGWGLPIPIRCIGVCGGGTGIVRRYVLRMIPQLHP